MAWTDELTLVLRVIINDLGEPPVYSDQRLQQVICVAAQYVLTEIDNWNFPSMRPAAGTPPPYYDDDDAGELPSPAYATDGNNEAYQVSVPNLTITPDPCSSTIRDLGFMNLITLKGACFVDQANLRSQAALSNVKAMLGRDISLDTTNHMAGFMNILANGPCKSYDDLKKTFKFGYVPGRAILGPFVGNFFDPRILASYVYRENGIWSPNSISSDGFFTG